MDTLQLFLDAYKLAWSQHLLNSNHQRIAETYLSNHAWTEFMLSPDISCGNDPSGLIASVARNLQQTIPDLVYQGREVYTLDAVFVSNDCGSARNKPDLAGRYANGYPSKLYALIEHENDEPIEEEMWKLLWWRAPLKVIICYDYTDAERKRDTSKTLKKANWLSSKLAMLAGMHRRVDTFFGENSSTRYLLIVGSRQGDTSPGSGADLPYWRYAVLPDTRLLPLGC